MNVTLFCVFGHLISGGTVIALRLYGWQECAMLSKCANPECSESFRYLHEGRIFHLAPTPEVRITMGKFQPALHERFWLCTRCSREMTLIWGGTQIRLAPVDKVVRLAVPLPKTQGEDKHAPKRKRLRARAASAGREDK
jgi:hypothetical protein